jgi:acyl-coenzyme A synthetase/AMP-(fatty) acid ligase
MKLGDAIPGQYDLGKLRLLGSVGEPINPEAWMWYHRVIGGTALSDRRYLVADRNRLPS